MTLEQAYDAIRATLRPQVQGTCGLYSFYNAVQILRRIDTSLRAIPAPKKCDAGSGASESLRQFAKREFKSGQGEILTAEEMTRLVTAWGYKVVCCGQDDETQKSRFLTEQTAASHPVLVAYLARDSATKQSVTPTTLTKRNDVGAHWSLVLGTEGEDASVVEPNAPEALGFERRRGRQRDRALLG